jgi:hypothetical protein
MCKELHCQLLKLLTCLLYLFTNFFTSSVALCLEAKSVLTSIYYMQISLYYRFIKTISFLLS